MAFDRENSFNLDDVKGKLDPEVKTKWIEALRSGEYRQTKNLLKDEDCFCCLGVLAHIQSVPYGVITDSEGDMYEGYIFPDETDFARSEDLPDGYCELTRTTQNALASLNDDEDATFEDIATIIEEKL